MGRRANLRIQQELARANALQDQAEVMRRDAITPDAAHQSRRYLRCPARARRGRAADPAAYQPGFPHSGSLGDSFSPL